MEQNDRFNEYLVDDDYRLVTAGQITEDDGRNPSAVVACSLGNRKIKFWADDQRVDTQDILYHPTEKHIQAVSIEYERKNWPILYKTIEPVLPTSRQDAFRSD